MCLILFALRAHPRYPLIVAANRDESYDRPAAPAAFWSEHPGVYGGRDLQAGGTWLAVSLSGRFAGVTNYRQGRRSDGAPRSRGELTRDYLTGTMDVADYLESVERKQSDYHGFSLIAGTPDRMFFCSNRGGGYVPIAPGVHGLSNRLLDEPWPKVERGIAVIEGLLHASEADLKRELFELLGDRAAAPDHLLPSTGIGIERERVVSASFIPGATYGTRASTVVLMSADGEVLFCERTFGPIGTPGGSSERRFALAKAATPDPSIAAAG
jgi:uncharacterized protein with NRDE domain